MDKEYEQKKNDLISEIQKKDYLDVKEAAQLLGASRWTIARLIKSGKIRSVKLGSKVVIARSSLDQLFQPLDQPHLFD